MTCSPATSAQDERPHHENPKKDRFLEPLRNCRCIQCGIPFWGLTSGGKGLIALFFLQTAMEHDVGALEGLLTPGGGIRIAEQAASRTGITDRQTEQLYDKMSLARRQMVFELFQQVAGGLAPHLVSSKPAVPSQWQLRTLDSGRFFPFQWCSIHFQCLPEQESKEKLHALCMSVLEVLALPICAHTCRYEFLRQSGGQVVSIAAPLHCLEEFVRVHKLEGDTGDHFHQLRALWKKEKVKEDLFRQMALTIFKFRQHGTVPVIVLHSSVDNKSLWICFRDFEAISNDQWLRGILQINESDNQRFHPDTPLRSTVLVSWPTKEHSAEVDRPQFLCQNPKCLKGDDRLVPESAAVPFLTHEGPREKRMAAFVKRMMGTIWHEKYEDLLATERDQILVAEGAEGDRERTQQVQRDLLDKYEEMASSHESELASQWRLDNCTTKMRRCSACKKVNYCSSDCQKADRTHHKITCGLLLQAKA